MKGYLGACVVSAAVATAAACGGGACTDAGAAGSAFVIVEHPRSGQRVASGFGVSGCSSTFEGNVTWRLRARNGRILANGFTQGGSLDSGAFAFTVEYAISSRQIGHLEVVEPRVTEEGFPPAGDSVPLVLEP